MTSMFRKLQLTHSSEIFDLNMKYKKIQQKTLKGTSEPQGFNLRVEHYITYHWEHEAAWLSLSRWLASQRYLKSYSIDFFNRKSWDNWTVSGHLTGKYVSLTSVLLFSVYFEISRYKKIIFECSEREISRKTSPQKMIKDWIGLVINQW